MLKLGVDFEREHCPCNNTDYQVHSLLRSREFHSSETRNVTNGPVGLPDLFAVRFIHDGLRPLAVYTPHRIYARTDGSI